MGGYSKKVWGWMMYDWAAQPYNTIVITFIFAPYFASEVIGDSAKGQSLILLTTSLVGFLIAISAPIIGALADNSGQKKMYMALFSTMYAIGAMGLWYAVPLMENYHYILLLFGIGLFGMELSQVFINSMLPDMGADEEVGQVSSNGWALGYVGGLVLLFIMLFFFFADENGLTILKNEPAFGLDATAKEGTRAAGPLTTLWYLVFIIPFFLWVPETKPKAIVSSGRSAVSELMNTIKGLKDDLSLAAFLTSSMFYRDALVGVYAVGGIYAKGVLDWSQIQLAIFGIVGGVSAAVFTFIGGYIERRIGTKQTIKWTIILMILISVVLIGTTKTTFMGIELMVGSSLPTKILYFAGAVIGAGGGVMQASSRTMLVKQANPDRMTEAFGLYALTGKSTAWITTLLMGVVTALSSSQQIGIVPVVVFFIIGLCLLYWVRVDTE
jgi:UMF1 family MFS transporter